MIVPNTGLAQHFFAGRAMFRPLAMAVRSAALSVTRGSFVARWGTCHPQLHWLAELGTLAEHKPHSSVGIALAPTRPCALAGWPVLGDFFRFREPCPLRLICSCLFSASAVGFLAARCAPAAARDFLGLVFGFDVFARPWGLAESWCRLGLRVPRGRWLPPLALIFEIACSASITRCRCDANAAWAWLAARLALAAPVGSSARFRRAACILVAASLARAARYSSKSFSSSITSENFREFDLRSLVLNSIPQKTYKTKGRCIYLKNAKFSMDGSQPKRYSGRITIARRPMNGASFATEFSLARQSHHSSVALPRISAKYSHIKEII